MHAATHSDRTAETMRDTASNPKAKPSPVLSFGGEKRLEDALRIVDRDPTAAVGQPGAHMRIALLFALSFTMAG